MPICIVGLILLILILIVVIVLVDRVDHLKPIIITKFEDITLVQVNMKRYVVNLYVDESKFDKCRGNIKDTEEMVRNLIASIFGRYSTINNIVVERVVKSAIGGASQDIARLE
jgi:hypothetical protein